MIRPVLSEPTDFRRLYLFRHPELDASCQGRAIGAGPATLSRRGRAQVLEWAQWIDGVELEAVHCSPQPQCSEAAIAMPAPEEEQRLLERFWQQQRIPPQERPRWLEQRKTDTAAALERGVFGAPSFVIEEDIFWGQDRLDFVAKRLSKGA